MALTANDIFTFSPLKHAPTPKHFIALQANVDELVFVTKEGAALVHWNTGDRFYISAFNQVAYFKYHQENDRDHWLGSLIA